MAADPTDDDIDLETLQARINLSMAFAHDLVSSWVSPSLRSGQMPRKDYEKELEEGMRRPPRLGVGAPIPESATTFRETARLKNRLMKVDGKKRAREEEDNVQRRHSDDEEESRAGAIRKKAKLDKFGEQKRKSENSLLAPHSIPGFSNGVSTQAKGATQPAASISSPESSAKKRKKKRKQPSILNVASSNTNPPAVPSPAQDSTASPREKALQIPSLSQSKTKGMSDDDTTQVFDISPLVTPTPLPSSKRMVVSYDMVHKLPLLNLDGPPGDDHDDLLSVLSGSAKRRRRKRSRKRKLSLVGTLKE